MEQHLGEAGGWDVAEGPGLSPIGGERAQAGAQGHSGRNQIEGRWGLELSQVIGHTRRWKKGGAGAGEGLAVRGLR